MSRPTSALALALTLIASRSERLLNTKTLGEAHNRAVDLDVFVNELLRAERTAAPLQPEEEGPTPTWDTRRSRLE